MSLPGLDWLLDRSVIGGYSKLGYRLRGLDASDPDPWARLRGSTVAITGANSGIGFAASRQFAKAGARVLMLVRDHERGEWARARIAEDLVRPDLAVYEVDVADLDSVAEAAARIRRAERRIDTLVHNAGALFQERRRSPQGFELTFATHVLGPFALTAALTEPLAADGGARVLFVSSGGAYTARLDVADPELERREFNGPRFYAHAKRAQLALTPELNRRLAAGVSVHAMHPGWAKTPGVAESLPGFDALLGPLLRSPAAGADTIVWLAAAPEAESPGGRLWMDRRPRPLHRVPWTQEEEGEAGRLYAYCCERIEAGEVEAIPAPEG